MFYVRIITVLARVARYTTTLNCFNRWLQHFGMPCCELYYLWCI